MTLDEAGEPTEASQAVLRIRTVRSRPCFRLGDRGVKASGVPGPLPIEDRPNKEQPPADGSFQAEYGVVMGGGFSQGRALRVQLCRGATHGSVYEKGSP